MKRNLPPYVYALLCLTVLSFAPRVCAAGVGTYDLSRAGYSGNGHSQMLTKAVVMNELDYSAWESGQKVAMGSKPSEEPAKPPAAMEPPAPKAVPEAAPLAPPAPAPDKMAPALPPAMKPPAPVMEPKVAVPDAQKAAKGEMVMKSKGCTACHTTDGSKRVGPTFKGLWGSTATVKTGGEVRKVKVDEDYVKRSINDPRADVVEGFPPLMPALKLTVDEEEAVIEYLKTLNK